MVERYEHLQLAHFIKDGNNMNEIERNRLTFHALQSKILQYVFRTVTEHPDVEGTSNLRYEVLTESRPLAERAMVKLK